MKKAICLALLLLLLAIFTACDKEDDDDDNNDASPAGDDDTSPNGGADDDNDTETPTYVEKYEFDLSFEVDFKAVLRMKQYSDGSLEGALTPEAAFDVVAAGVTLSGAGRLVQFPEAYTRMIILKLQGPIVTGGKCGDATLSYSLALTGRQDNGYVVGALTAYCGAETYSGRPARVMRLTGLQERIE